MRSYDGYINVLEAQRSHYTAQDSVAQSDQLLVEDLIAIYKALGGGWQTAAGPARRSMRESRRRPRRARRGISDVFEQPPLMHRINIPPVSAARRLITPTHSPERSTYPGVQYRGGKY